MKKKAYIIGSSILGLFLFLVAAHSFAGETEQTKIIHRITELQQEIADNSAEYQSLSPVAANNRSKCELAAMQEKQLAQLNASNSVKRREMEVYHDILGSIDPTQPQVQE